MVIHHNYVQISGHYDQKYHLSHSASFKIAHEKSTKIEFNEICFSKAIKSNTLVVYCGIGVAVTM